MANKRIVNTLTAMGRTDEAVAESQTLCWLLEADDASLTGNQRSIRDAVRAACGG